MKKLLVLALALSLCFILLPACSGGGSSDTQGGGGNNTQGTKAKTVKTDVFTMSIPDGWKVAEQTSASVKLEKDTTTLTVEFSQMGFPPPPENIQKLSYSIAGYTWTGGIYGDGDNLHFVEAKFTNIDGYCVVFTRGATFEDSDVVKMMESITVTNPDAKLPLATFF